MSGLAPLKEVSDEDLNVDNKNPTFTIPTIASDDDDVDDDVDDDEDIVDDADDDVVDDVVDDDEDDDEDDEVNDEEADDTNINVKDEKNIIDDESDISPPNIKLENYISINDESDDDDDDDDDDDYLQKFDKEVKSQFLEEFHPESLSHNYDEIKNLAKVARNKNGNIIDPLHKTTHILTKYEKTRILGQRAKQINAGAKPFVEVKEGIIDGYIIALKELELKKIPFIIKRPIPNGGFEYWYVSDLEILD